MPYEVSQLLKDIGTPVTATPDEPIQDALDRMLHYSFSQLPVVKGVGQSRQFYFITYESILLALHNFGSRVQGSSLRVDDALVKVPNVYRSTDDLFELLLGIREMDAALIVDDDRNIIHVITSYDTTCYFRQWAENIMQVRDIEHGLRRIINCSFKKADGEIDEQARKSAVEEITSSNKALRKKFVVALQQYIKQNCILAVPLKQDWVNGAFAELLNGSKSIAISTANECNCEADASIPVTASCKQESAVIDSLSASKALHQCFELALTYYLEQQAAADVELVESLVEDAFKVIYNRSEQTKEFAELTLADYIQLFFNDICWRRCQDVVRLKQEEVQHMLEGVRDTRNDLAHFREEKITAQKRLQLKRCSDWLSEREHLIIGSFDKT